MPEFRRGWGRWLPADAERDWFRPSYEDLRALGLRGSRLRVATIVLWADCWRVWLGTAVSLPRPRQPLGGHEGHARVVVPSLRKDHRAMLMQDLRRALRLFRFEPGFSAAAVLTLALGIGANTALFAVVEAVFLRPLPLSDAEALVVVRHRDNATGLTKDYLAVGDVIDLRARMQTLEPFTPYGGTQATLYGEGEPMRVEALAATPELLAALRVPVSVGRLLTADDTRPKAPPVALISHELWETRFGSDPNIVGRGLVLGNARVQVVGVIDRGFHYPPTSPTHLIVPFRELVAPPQRKSDWVYGMGRLKAGVTLDAVRAELAALSSEFERAYPDQNRGTLYYPVLLRDALVGDARQPLLLLLAAVAFILLIACVNVGNLLLARSLARRQEMAVRTALGAGWARLASQVMVEALVLAGAGGVIGAIVAWQAAPILAGLVPDTTRVPGLRDVGINLTVLAYAMGASVAAALVFGGLACLGIARHDQRSLLAAARGSSTGLGPRRAASMLVAAEIALAAVLLLGAGLTLRSFGNLMAVDPGFRPDAVLTMTATVPSARYSTPPARADFYARAFEALEALPEVERAGIGVVMPLTGNNWTVPFERVDRPAPSGERPPDVGWQAATGGYFTALGIPLLSGRLFVDADAAAPVAPVIVSAEIARLYFADEMPIGHRLKVGDSQMEIIGVVGDIRRGALTEAPRADVYFAFSRSAATSATLFIKTAQGDPVQAIPAIRSALRRLEPEVILHQVRPMADVVAASTAAASLAMRLMSGFAALALVLAAIGIYGVMAYSVRRRSREIGTRVALGARHTDIVRMIMREGGVITVSGVAAGLALGLVAARALAAMLFGVPSTDPVSIAGAAGILAAAAMAACYVPARRAARIDATRTLAAE